MQKKPLKNLLIILAECQQSTFAVESKIAEWNESLEGWVQNNIQKRNMDLEEFCKPRILLDHLIWAEELTYAQIFDYCRRMDGTLPQIDDMNPLNKGWSKF